MLGAPAGDRALERARREPVDRRRGREPRRRRHADDLQILGLRGDVVRFSERELRAAAGEPRFGLRDVGARHLARGEAVARLPQRHFQHVDVAALQLENGRSLQQVHVSGSRAEQHGLLGGAQLFARGEHLAFGLTRAACRLQAVEQRLRRGDPVGLYRLLAPQRGEERAAGRGADAGPAQVIQILIGQARGAAHARAITGKRAGDVLVNRARCGALGIELGIVLVRLNQRDIHRAGARARPHEPRAIAVLPTAVLSTAVLPSAGLPSASLPSTSLSSTGLPVAGLPVASLPSGDLRSGKRREQKRGACGKRCNPRDARNRSPPQSPPAHAQTPAPRAPAFAVAARRALTANVSHNGARNPLSPQRKRRFSEKTPACCFRATPRGKST